MRVELLCLTPECGILHLRLLSILEHAASAREERHVLGGFRSLIDLPSDSDLNAILDGASRVLTPKKKRYDFELRSIFDKWLKRRLDSPAPIAATQLASWIKSIQVERDRYPEPTLASLKARFEREPSLFEEVFEELASKPSQERSFLFFVFNDLRRLLPATVWPVPQCEFFLARAEKENDPERGAAFFQMYVNWFPSEGASVALAEAGFDLLDRRRAVAQTLGNWNICEIEEWRRDQSERLQKESRERSENRAQNIAYLTPRLTAIREGGEEKALLWAVPFYLGFIDGTEDVSEPRERLVKSTTEEIADALIEGIIRYAENPIVAKKETLIRNYELLSLSVFLRFTRGMTVPQEALPNCIAAVVTSHVGDTLPDYDDKLSEWLLRQASENPTVVKSALKKMWVSDGTSKKRLLPGFDQLSRDPGSQQFLASLSADVLKTQINEDHGAVAELVSVLLRHDQEAAVAIGQSELIRDELSPEVRAIWITILFVIDPSRYLQPWRTYMSEPDAALWEAIDVIGGGRDERKNGISLTLEQRTEVITSVGTRCPNVGHPSDGWIGSRNPWNASEFVANQIKLLAADISPTADAQLERLEVNGALASYRELIRHQRAQHQRRRRESSFSFALPEQVAEAISNRAPATPSDLLAFVVDHFDALSQELARTQRERYRGYWNESGRSLVEPKREEICSGLLADDLQNRIKAQGLIVSVEHHMIEDKECDLVVLQGTDRLLPIEVKHHYNAELWTAWQTQLDRLYTRDAKASGLGIYLVLWSGEAKNRKMLKLPHGLKRPTSAAELKSAIESLVPEADRHRLKVVVVDISGRT